MFKVNIHEIHYFFFLDQVDRTPFKSAEILPSDAEDTQVVKSMLTMLNNIKKDNWVAIVVSGIGYSAIMLFYTIKLFCHLKAKQQCCFKKKKSKANIDPDAVHGVVPRRPLTRSQTRKQSNRQEDIDIEVNENI